VFRRYRFVPDDELQALYMAAVREYDGLIQRYANLIAGPARRLMKSYGRELRIRSRRDKNK